MIKFDKINLSCNMRPMKYIERVQLEHITHISTVLILITATTKKSP